MKSRHVQDTLCRYAQRKDAAYARALLETRDEDGFLARTSRRKDVAFIFKYVYGIFFLIKKLSLHHISSLYLVCVLSRVLGAFSFEETYTLCQSSTSKYRILPVIDVHSQLQCF